MFNREKFLAETMLRIKIQKMLQEKKGEKLSHIRKERAKNDLRKLVRNMLSEAKKSPIPFANTGIAVLQDTLKKINPIIHDDFITLTTDPAQRRSFRAHIINGFINVLAPMRAMDGDPTGDIDAGFGNTDEMPLMAAPGPDELSEGPLDDPRGKLPPKGPRKPEQPDAHDKFLETDPEMEKNAAEPEMSPEEEEAKKFAVAGEDETGRNMALQTFKKISKTVSEAYHLLSNPDDKEKFYEYGIINLKLYFDTWEENLTSDITEFF